MQLSYEVSANYKQNRPLAITTMLKAVDESLVILYNKHLLRSTVQMSSDDDDHDGDVVAHLL